MIHGGGVQARLKEGSLAKGVKSQAGGTVEVMPHKMPEPEWDKMGI